MKKYTPLMITFIISIFFLINLNSYLLASPYEPINGNTRETPIVKAIKKATPAVVSIYTKTITNEDNKNNEISGALGSGVIIDGKRGLIITNEHVIKNSSLIVVALSNGYELPATILGMSPEYDLAILKIDSPTTLPELKLANTSEVMIGETVIAIGNPFGLSHTATVGVISATNRTVNREDIPRGSLSGLVQTDASINPGNSGGPLINLNAEIVGINTIAASKGTNLGFAIPAEQVSRVSEAILNKKTDIQIDINFDAILDLGLKLKIINQDNKTLIKIMHVEDNSPAKRAGIIKNDYLISLDNKQITSLHDYSGVLKTAIPNKLMNVVVHRYDINKHLTLKPKVIEKKEILANLKNTYGLVITEDSNKRELVIQAPIINSLAEEAGLENGDLIYSFEETEVHNLEDLINSYVSIRFKHEINFKVKRNKILYHVTLSL